MNNGAVRGRRSKRPENDPPNRNNALSPPTSRAYYFLRLDRQTSISSCLVGCWFWFVSIGNIGAKQNTNAPLNHSKLGYPTPSPYLSILTFIVPNWPLLNVGSQNGDHRSPPVINRVTQPSNKRRTKTNYPMRQIRAPDSCPKTRCFRPEMRCSLKFTLSYRQLPRARKAGRGFVVNIKSLANLANVEFYQD